MKTLESLGFSDWFKQRVDAEMSAQHDVARVVSVHRDRYTITKGAAEVPAEISGHLSYSTGSVEQLPTTGDWVYADFYDDDSHAIIHQVFPRKSLLKRKTAGRLVDYQLIAANIDVAFIIQSVDFNFNLRRMERYLVMVYESGVTPVILLSKCDLVSAQELDQIRHSVLTIAPAVELYALSSLNGEGMQAIKDSLLPARSYCLLGSSGVGKTTLLNAIIGSEVFETQAVSRKQNKGRHTTTSRELIQLENGAMFVDTPGMRELGNLAVESGIDETFSEIVELSRLCKFNNCSHTSEKGCAILAAIDAGELSEKRYKNYLRMKNESAFNEMSYHQKRQKDKDFGKLIKATLKNKQS